MGVMVKLPAESYGPCKVKNRNVCESTIKRNNRFVRVKQSVSVVWVSLGDGYCQTCYDILAGKDRTYETKYEK